MDLLAVAAEQDHDLYIEVAPLILQMQTLRDGLISPTQGSPNWGTELFYGARMRLLLWHAAMSCKWDWDILNKLFPNLVTKGGVLGIAYPGTMNAAMIYALSGGGLFELSTPMGPIAKQRRDILDASGANEWRIEKKGDEFFLVFIRLQRAEVMSTAHRRETTRVLIRDGAFGPSTVTNEMLPAAPGDY